MTSIERENTMPNVLVADTGSEYQAGMIHQLAKCGYTPILVTSVRTALRTLGQEAIQVAVLGAEFEGVQAADLIPLLKIENRNLAIVLVADDPAPQLARRIRQAGIFYHALRPSDPEDTGEILQAVKCAVTRLNQSGLNFAGQDSRQENKSSTIQMTKGEHHENEKPSSRNNFLSVDLGNTVPGRSSCPGGSQRFGGLGISRLLRINRHGATCSGDVTPDRHGQRTGDWQEQNPESISQVIARPLLQLIITEVIMTRWIILGGAVVFASGLTALAALVPELFHGFSGIVIWMFLGFCSIIVVAQLFSAVRALLALTQKPFAQKIEQLVRGGKS
jgi:CheY-like chemotaxis protein